MNRFSLKALRNRYGLTQTRAARKLGLSKRGYQFKEQGRRKITRQEIRLIACFRLIERLKAEIRAQR
jgi:DNA-binding XRE family transcriptional regulator